MLVVAELEVLLLELLALLALLDRDVERILEKRRWMLARAAHASPAAAATGGRP